MHRVLRSIIFTVGRRDVLRLSKEHDGQGNSKRGHKVRKNNL